MRRIRAVLTETTTPIEVEPTVEHVQTATIGVASLDDLPLVNCAEELFKAADEALYAAESSGKNSWRRAASASDDD